MEDLYYDGATQLKYFRHGTYHGGIGYHDFIIDGETAQTIPISKILKWGAREEIPEDIIIVELDWCSLNDKILYGNAL